MGIGNNSAFVISIHFYNDHSILSLIWVFMLQYVPEKFLRRNLLSNDEKIGTCVLEVSDGRKWGPVKCRDYKTCGKLYGCNWKKFRDDNQLGVGDVCVLELMNAKKKLLKVTINRACDTATKEPERDCRNV